MAKRLNYEKKYRTGQTRQIGEADDAATSMWKIKADVRRRLYSQQPDLSHEELEKRVNRIVSRGLKRVT